MAVNNSQQTLKLPQDASETALFIEFCDKLFDSLNGSQTFSREGKHLRTAVTSTSPHLGFWREAIKILSSIKFVTKTGYCVPPSIKNFIQTLKNFQLLFYNLKKVGFTKMKPRTFNQDGLENFFGNVRQKGARFTNPTAAAFTPFYKSLLINNISTKHSKGSNCEEDNLNMLVTLEQLINHVSQIDINSLNKTFTSIYVFRFPMKKNM